MRHSPSAGAFGVMLIVRDRCCMSSLCGAANPGCSRLSAGSLQPRTSAISVRIISPNLKAFASGACAIARKSSSQEPKEPFARASLTMQVKRFRVVQDFRALKH